MDNTSFKIEKTSFGKTSDEPGIQFYTGNFLDGTLPSKTEGKYNFRTGFCLETQHFPDSPNQKKFPTVELNPGEKYLSKTSLKFRSDKDYSKIK